MEQNKRYEIFLDYVYYYILAIDEKEGTQLLQKMKYLLEKEEDMESNNWVLCKIYQIQSGMIYGDLDINSYYLEKYFFYQKIIQKSCCTTKETLYFNIPTILFLNRINTAQLEQKVGNFGKRIGCYYKKLEYLFQAEYYFDVGEIQKGSRFLSLTNNEDGESGISQFSSDFFKSRLSLATGEENQFKYYYDKINQLQSSCSLPYENSFLSFMKNYLNAVLKKKNHPGNSEKIHKNSLPNRPISFIYQIEWISEGFLYLAREQFFTLEKHLQRMSNFYKENPFTYGIIYYSIFQIITDCRRNRFEQAGKHYKGLLERIKESHIIMPIIELSAYFMPVINLPYQYEIANIIKTKASLYQKSCNLCQNKPVLTKREQEVVGWIEKGYKRREIAEQLCVSDNTIKQHMSNIYHKLNVSSKAEMLKKVR